MVKNKYIAPFLIATLVAVIIISIINGCQHEVVDKKNLRKIIFETEILPIFLNNCTASGCHDGSGDVQPDLRTYDGIMKGIVKGNPSSSNIYSAITATYFNLMPPGGALQPADRARIRLWIEQGAENSKPDTTNHLGNNCDTSHLTFSGTVKKILSDNCFACHSNSTSAYGANIKLEDSSDVVTRITHIIGDMKHANGFDPMPKGGTQIEPCKIAQIEIWARKINNHVSQTCDTSNVTYDSTIKKILTDNCYSCHSNVNAATFGGNTKLENYSDVVSKIVRISGDIQQKIGFDPMPKGGGQLDSCSITQFEIWARSNPKDTTTQPPVDTSNYAKRSCFMRDVLPVILSSCAMSNCHDNVTAQGDYRFINYANIRNAVVPGYPSRSRLYTSIVTGGGEDIMPPSGYPHLTQAQIDTIRNWIQYGALNEQCYSSSCDTSNVTFSGIIWPIITANCRGCHNSGNRSGNINLDNYSDISNTAKSGLLMNALNGTGGKILMPPGNALVKCKIEQIDKWSRNGAPNN